MLTLDTKTMKFSVRELPPCPDPEQDDAFFRRVVVAGESKDGALCIVRVAASGIYAWLWLIDDDCGGGHKWVLRNILKYTGVAAMLHNIDTPDVVAIRDGFVYLATSDTVLSLCLETWKLEKLFSMGNYCEDFNPYFMAWPCSLVGNYGRFAVFKIKMVLAMMRDYVGRTLFSNHKVSVPTAACSMFFGCFIILNLLYEHHDLNEHNFTHLYAVQLALSEYTSS